MKNIYREYLFTKNLLVAHSIKPSKTAFQTLFSMASLFGVKITKGQAYASLNHVEFLEVMLGHKVPDPFYKGFPQTVRELTKEELLFDQLLSYFKTYDLNDFSTAQHSVMEENFNRIAFKEKTNLKTFEILSISQAEEVLLSSIKDLLSSSRPLSYDNYQLVLNYIKDYNFTVQSCNSKNTAIRLLIDTRDVQFANFLDLSDIIKVVEEIDYYEYYSLGLKSLNLVNQDRKFITKLLDKKLGEKNIDLINCYEKQADWCGLLHHIHYKPKSENGESFVKAMRSGNNLSAYSLFEKALKEGDINTAVEILKKYKGAGAVLRNLNYLVSRCSSSEQINFVLQNALSKNKILLLQLLISYDKKERESRAFKFVKFNKLLVHKETEEEILKRNSRLTSEQKSLIKEFLLSSLKEICKNKINSVYIDEQMKNIALPLQESTAMSGYGVLPKGSKIKVDLSKKIRVFTYWEQVDDIDLGIIGIDENDKEREFSWRNMFKMQSDWLTFSGDQTAGFNGGSEYYDLDLQVFKEKNPQITHLVFCNNVFSPKNFSQLLCKAGYMLRDKQDSGQVFEPKTVKSSFNVNCDSRFAYLFAIDLKNEQIIWLNVGRDSDCNIAGATDNLFISDYFEIANTINYYEFFKMLATNVVSSPSEANLIVSDKSYDLKPGQEQIKSYDVSKVMAYLNN